MAKVKNAEKLVIIDGNSLLNRAFYALPLLTNANGEYSNAVFGFANTLMKAIFDLKPEYIVVAMDYGKKTFRNELYSGYKGKRRPTPPELLSQFPVLKRMLKEMNIKVVEKKDFEADDLIGTLSKKFLTENIIVTGDRDSLQLINDHTQVWLTKKGISEVKVMNRETFKEEYSIDVEQFIDLKALMGDSSDNIPGVPGVGEKTAIELMKTYGSLDNIYENVGELKGKLKEKMESGRELAYLSKTLSTIKCDVEMSVKLKDLKYDFPFDKGVYDFFVEYQFNSLLKRTDIFKDFDISSGPKKYSVNVIEIKTIQDLEKQIEHIKRAKVLACELTGEKFSFAYDKNCEFFVNSQPNLLAESIDLSNALNMLKDVLLDSEIKKLVYDKKRLYHALTGFDLTIKGVEFDCILAYYLLCAGEREANKINLLSKYGLEEEYDAVNLFYYKELLVEELKNADLMDLYNKIEVPLTDVLFEMEQDGFKINKDVLFELEERYSKEVVDLEQSIKQIAGKEVNLNSPKQLAELLFDDLQLVTYNNKKRSTSAEILEEMTNMHPIVPLIIRYRKIKKIVTTYLEPYKEMLKNGDIIHTVFNQTLTTTGRLSSSEPNLQNIPVREGEGRNLRKMFVSRFDDGALVSADYSQIELRLLAHFSQDENLIRAFNENVDIHSLTASEIFGVPIADVDSNMRRTAKAVNFGIVYGMSDFGLGQSIGCTKKQAKEYIDRYFAKYASIRNYLDMSVESAKETGYATTLFKRRRKINELKSPTYMSRQFGERVAMNAPLQGSASDIIKLAMINVSKALKEGGYKSKLIMQVHDELIIDATRDEVVTVAKLLKQNMENVVKLSVPLVADVESGPSWFDC